MNNALNAKLILLHATRNGEVAFGDVDPVKGGMKQPIRRMVIDWDVWVNAGRPSQITIEGCTFAP